MHKYRMAANVIPQLDNGALSGAECLCRWLLLHGIETVFTVPGSQTLPLINTMSRCSKLRIITTSHEAGAAYMADGLARRSGKPAVCISIGGPGASNMLTAAATAFQDDSPVLFITGNVCLAHDGVGAFQDAGPNGSDDATMFHTAIGQSFSLSRRSALVDTLENVWQVLQRGRPAHLMLSLDIQIAYHVEPMLLSDAKAAYKADHKTSYVHEINTFILQARRPLVLAGHRVSAAKSRRLLRRFCECWNIPLVTTLAGKSLLSEYHPLALGNTGYAGQRKANTALLNSTVDLLLVIGADLNERDTLGWHPAFKPSTRTVLCLDSRKLTTLKHDLVDACFAPLDLPSYLQSLCELAPSFPPLRNLSQYTANAPEPTLARPASKKLAVTQLIDVLQSNLPADTACYIDSGSCRVFAGQRWQAKSENSFFTASGSAPMGWALGAAIGAGFNSPATPSLLLTGDGCMLMHGTELAVAARHNIPIIIVLLDNGGMSSTLRTLPAGEKHCDPYLAPKVDWIAFAHSLGVHGQSIDDLNELPQLLRRLADLDAPYLLHLQTDPLEKYLFPEYT